MDCLTSGRNLENIRIISVLSPKFLGGFVFGKRNISVNQITVVDMPTDTKLHRQLVISAINVIMGIPITPANPAPAVKKPTALPRCLAGVKSVIAAVAIGGTTPPRPEIALNPTAEIKFQAKLVPIAPIIVPINPNKSTGFRPYMSDIGPAINATRSQTIAIGAVNWLMTGTLTDMSLPISISKGPIIIHNKVWEKVADTNADIISRR